MSTSTPQAPPVDPYGVDLAISAGGDIVVNASGSLTAVSGVYNCAQAIFARLKTAPGELALHPAYGSHVAGSLVGSKLNIGGIITQANADLQTMLAEDPRFLTAQITNASTPANSNYPHDSVALGVQATLVGGEQLQLGSVSDPAPSDVTLPQAVAPSTDPTLTYDPLAQQQFFADQPELDTLNDLNEVQAIVNDTPNSSILGTGG